METRSLIRTGPGFYLRLLTSPHGLGSLGQGTLHRSVCVVHIDTGDQLFQVYRDPCAPDPFRMKIESIDEPEHLGDRHVPSWRFVRFMLW